MHSSRMRNVRSSSHVYPSMHWALCIPACTGRGCVSQHALGGVCISQHALGGGCVSQHALGTVYPSMHWALCIPACTGRGCVSQHALGGVCISQHALGRGVCTPACTRQGVSSQVGCLPGGMLSAQWGSAQEGVVCPGRCLLEEGGYPSTH